MVILYIYLFTGFIIVLRTGIANVLAKSFRDLVLDYLGRPGHRQKMKAIFAGLPLFIVLCIVPFALYPIMLYTRRRTRRPIAAGTGITVPYKQQMPGYPPIYHN